jgi:glutamate transport system permease protein
MDADVWQFIGKGVLGTLQAAAVAAVLAVVIGIVFATLRTTRSAWVRVPTTVVLEFFRGMPVLLLMLFILLASSSGTYWAVVLGLAVYNGAIIGEALRAGLASLPRGQREAGLSLGLTPLQTKTYVEFPQAFRQMLPVIVAQLVVLLKDTSLGYIVGYNELIRTTMNNLAAFYGSKYLFSLFLVTLVIYLAINLSLSALARRLARRRSPGALVPKDQITPTASISVMATQNINPEDRTTE